MKKALSLLSLALLTVALVGCKTTPNPNVGPGLVRLGVSSGASYSLLKFPQAVPAVRASADIICSQANGTNLNPASVVAAVNAYAQQTPESVLIVNSALGAYTLIWNSYGVSAVTNTPTLKLYLSATCDGLTDALAAVPVSGIVRANAPVMNPAFPQVQFK